MVTEVPKPDKLAGKPETVLSDLDHLNKLGWFPAHELSQMGPTINTINGLIGNLTYVMEKLREGDESNEALLKRLRSESIVGISGDERSAMGDKVVRRGRAGTYVRRAFATNIGVDDPNDLSKHQISEALEGIGIATRALFWEEMLNATGQSRKPNVFHSLFKLYVAGAFSVNIGEIKKGSGHETLSVDLPLVKDGKSYLLCHREGLREPTLYHGWEDHCSDAFSIKEPLPYEATSEDIQERMRQQMEKFRWVTVDPNNYMKKWVLKHQDLKV